MKLKYFAMLMTLLMAVSPVYALDWSQLNIRIPTSNLLATIQPNDKYTKTFSLDTTGVTFQSCHDTAYYQLGSCDYMYKCYIILPQDCSMVTCAKDYYCEELLTIPNPVALPVSYTGVLTDIGKTYAVSAFVMKSHMTYDFSTKKWTDYTTPVETTKQYDFITVQGAPIPPIPNPIEAISKFISNLVSGIKSWFCTNWGLWCV